MTVEDRGFMLPGASKPGDGSSPQGDETKPRAARLGDIKLRKASTRSIGVQSYRAGGKGSRAKNLTMEGPALCAASSAESRKRLLMATGGPPVAMSKRSFAQARKEPGPVFVTGGR